MTLCSQAQILQFEYITSYNSVMHVQE